MPARDSIHEVVMGEFYFFKVWITQCTHIRNFIAAACLYSIFLAFSVK